ncbi:hypothetical protein [Pseudomonas sp.]|uniref:hypothetical protein n=1 Tax=Pseudomonas sp. TaxID=306 RepID=UPI001D5A8E67|nr:hypothetical protein [Pseudomonas sp.]MBS6041037.1 hypothetical protein [Pseudomonas sp.]
MSKIDWSKAPESATGAMVAQFESGRIMPGYVEFIPAGRNVREIYSEGPEEWVYVERPWRGGGIPPVGTVVEIQRGGWTIREESAEFIGAEVTVCAVFQTARGVDMIAVDGGADLGCEVFRAEMARPVPTPEEKAEAERVAGLNEMIRHMKDHPGGTHGVSHMQQLMIHEDVARDLWAAGYRKQVAP